MRRRPWHWVSVGVLGAATMYMIWSERASTRRYRRVMIVYASETGTTEALAECLGELLERWQVQTDILSAEDYDPALSAAEDVLYCFMTSTQGRGEPPETARGLVKKLAKANISGALVVGVGNTSYDTYNAFGKKLFHELKRLDVDLLLDAPILVDTNDLHYKNAFLQAVEQDLRDRLLAVVAVSTEATSSQPSVRLILGPRVDSARPAKPQKRRDKSLFEAVGAALVEHRKADSTHVVRLQVKHTVSRSFDVCVGMAVSMWVPCTRAQFDLMKSLLEPFEDDTCIIDQTPRSIGGGTLFPTNMTVDHAIRYCVDFTGPCTPVFAHAILALLEGNDKPDCSVMLAHQLTVYDCLRWLQTCHPRVRLPLSILVSLPRASARAYTIGSDIRRADTEAAKTFQLVISEATLSPRSATVTKPHQQLRVFSQSPYEGRVREWLLEDWFDPAYPPLVSPLETSCMLSHAMQKGVWVGAGSGVGLFRAFLEHRMGVFKRTRRPMANWQKTDLILSLTTRATYELVAQASSESSIDIFSTAVRDGLVRRVIVCLTREPERRQHTVYRASADGLVVFEELKFYATRNPHVQDVLGSLLAGAENQPSPLLEPMDLEGNFIVCGSKALKRSTDAALGEQLVAQLGSRLIPETW